MMTGIRAVAAIAAFAVPDHTAAAADGCWVHAFAREQFRPPMTTYTGPSHEPIFMGNASSLIVGPIARLLGYAGNRYRKESLDLGPGRRVPDMAALDFDRRVDAFKVVCGDGDAERPVTGRVESLDADRDGYITRQEAMPQPTLFERFHLADRNRNGLLDRAELDEAAAVLNDAGSASGGASVAGGGAAVPAELFRQLDRDRDGYLNDEELTSVAATRSNWIARDRDGDGRHSPSEFTPVSPP